MSLNFSTATIRAIITYKIFLTAGCRCRPLRHMPYAYFHATQVYDGLVTT